MHRGTLNLSVAAFAICRLNRTKVEQISLHKTEGSIFQSRDTKKKYIV